jgi:uncharacterized membrane protein (Fun14 family)
MNTDSLISISTGIGRGFFGGLLLGYALKKVVKLIALVVGLFIAGLAYLQYQQIASVNWDKIGGTILNIANTTTNTFNNYNIERLATTNLGILLLVVYQQGSQSWIKTMFLQEISEQSKVLLM